MRALTTGLILSASLALSACSTISSVSSSAMGKVKGLFGGSSTSEPAAAQKALPTPASMAGAVDKAAAPTYQPAQGGQRGVMDIDPAHPFAR